MKRRNNMRMVQTLSLASLPIAELTSLATAQNPPDRGPAAGGDHRRHLTGFAAGTLTCQQPVGLYLDRVRAYQAGGPRLNAITTVNPKALEAAAALDALRQSSGRMGSLHSEAGSRHGHAG
jgi:Asp-tRNA(Asn)/Glu-tRNA(Gln) amidotransferase A subunit family amidase